MDSSKGNEGQPGPEGAVSNHPYASQIEELGVPSGDESPVGGDASGKAGPLKPLPADPVDGTDLSPASDQPATRTTPREQEKRQGQGAVARVHKVQSLAPSDPKDVFYGLDATHRSVIGWTGVLAVLLLFLGGGVLYVSLQLGQGEERTELFRRPSPEELPPEAPPPPGPLPGPQGLIQVTTDPPGAQVLVDSMLVDGVTPFQVPVFHDLSHRLQVSLAGYVPEVREVMLEAGQTTSPLHLDLRPLPPDGPTGIAVVYAEPQGVQIYHHQEVVGTTEARIDLPSGMEEVLVLRKEGYTPLVMVFTLFPNVENYFRVRLSPMDVDGHRRDLHLDSKPGGALVHQGDELVGMAPLLRRGLLNSRFTMELQKTGHHTMERTFWLGGNSIHYQAFLAREERGIGHLSVEATPRVTVYVGSEEVGPTPLRRIPLEEGTHQVTVSDRTGHLRGTFPVEVETDAHSVRKVSWKDGELQVR